MNFYSSNFVRWDILNGSPCISPLFCLICVINEGSRFWLKHFLMKTRLRIHRVHGPKWKPEVKNHSTKGERSHFYRSLSLQKLLTQSGRWMNTRSVLRIMYSESIVSIFWRIFSLSFVQKPPLHQNSDKMLAIKNRFTKMMNNPLYTVRVSPVFHHFIGVSSLFTNSI